MTVTAVDPARRRALKGEFNPPSLLPGDIVWWFQRGLLNNQPNPAIVIYDNGNGNLCLYIMKQNGSVPSDGVRHADDPSLSQDSMLRRGCWTERDPNKPWFTGRKRATAKPPGNNVKKAD